MVNHSVPEGFWIPAFAGMTVKPIAIISKWLNYHLFGSCCARLAPCSTIASLHGGAVTGPRLPGPGNRAPFA